MFDVDLAEIRFGFGRAPGLPAPQSVQAMLDPLPQPDVMSAAYPIEPFDVFRQRMVDLQAQLKIRRQNRGTAKAEAARKARNLINKDAREAAAGWMAQSLLRAAHTPTGFRERLVWFWADHFSAQGKRGVARRAAAPYVDDAIRPHIAGRFSDLLQAAVMHPLMILYLDQDRSMGPASKRAINSGGKFGLNENLAREVLELHSLGVNGPYDQNDVRQLAELFAGMTVEASSGLKYRKDWAEPGAETVLGATYSADPGLAPIRKVLDDLAHHPATAQHIARKLAVHFVSDQPDPALVAHIAARFLATDGDLTQIYAALLEHNSAWAHELSNIKPPADFMASAMRALAVDAQRIQSADEKQLRRGFAGPLNQLGQRWLSPPGPDGWDEADSHWITPQGLAERVNWAMAIPQYMRPDLPDPRAFVDTALGRFASERTRFAAAAAERRAEAIGLVLMSPAFQRR